MLNPIEPVYIQQYVDPTEVPPTQTRMYSDNNDDGFNDWAKRMW